MAGRKQASSKKKAAAKTEAKVAESVASNEQPKRTSNAPKLIWRGNAEPPAKVQIGIDAYEMPDEATQRAGFQHEAAARIARCVIGYKILKDKGTR